MSIETIAAELAHLRKDFDRHDEQDLEKFKYAHRMLEDLLTKTAASDSAMQRFRDERVSNAKLENAARQTLLAMDARLRSVERWQWANAGGIAVIVLLVSLVGGRIIKLLAGG